MLQLKFQNGGQIQDGADEIWSQMLPISICSKPFISSKVAVLQSTFEDEEQDLREEFKIFDIRNGQFLRQLSISDADYITSFVFDSHLSISYWKSSNDSVQHFKCVSLDEKFSEISEKCERVLDCQDLASLHGKLILQKRKCVDQSGKIRNEVFVRNLEAGNGRTFSEFQGKKCILKCVSSSAKIAVFKESDKPIWIAMKFN